MKCIVLQLRTDKHLQTSSMKILIDIRCVPGISSQFLKLITQKVRKIETPG